MGGRPGNTRDLSCENSAGVLFRRTALYMLTRPVNLALYWLSWHHLCALCRYGQRYRNVPVLAAGVLWWIGATGYGLWLWGRYKRGRCPVVFGRILLGEKGLVLAGAGEKAADIGKTADIGNAADIGKTADAGLNTAGAKDGLKREMPENAIKWYVKRRRFCQFFLRGKEVALLDLRQLTMSLYKMLDKGLCLVYNNIIY